MIEIYTDGSCYPNNGTGGGTGGFVVVVDDVIIHKYVESRKPTTNNRMELLGIILAFKYAITKYPDNLEIVKIYSDSKYCVDGFNQWYFGWLKKPKVKETKLNMDMWDYLHDLRRSNISLHWVKGHDINQYNNAADELVSDHFKLVYGIRPPK